MSKKEIQAKQQMLTVNIGGKPIHYYPMSEERAKQIKEHAKNNPVVAVCKTRKELYDWMLSVSEDEED